LACLISRQDAKTAKTTKTAKTAKTTKTAKTAKKKLFHETRLDRLYLCGIALLKGGTSPNKSFD